MHVIRLIAGQCQNNRKSTWDKEIHGRGKIDAWKLPTSLNTGPTFPNRTQTFSQVVLRFRRHPPISHNHGDQHTNYASGIGRTHTQLNDHWEHESPQEGTTQNNKKPHIPQHRIAPFQPHLGTSEGNSDIQMAPISTLSTLTKIKSPSTSTTSTPQQARKNISPIRFPTP